MRRVLRTPTLTPKRSVRVPQVEAEAEADAEAEAEAEAEGG